MESTFHQSASPLASLLLITFNQQDSVAAAIQGALSQTYSPLEIFISDDASSDDTFAVAEQCVRDYKGPHIIHLLRNEANLGISAHLSSLAVKASGEILLVAAGDDISMPERCARVMNAWLESGRRLDLIATDLLDLDVSGRVYETLKVTDLSTYHGFDDWSRCRPHVVGAAHAWSRRLFDDFGPIAPGVYGEDQIMVFRAIMSGGACTLQEALVQYRRGGLSRKRRWRTPEDFIARLKLANINGTGETRQLQQDADKVGEGARMRALLAKKAAREAYVSAVFDNRSLWKKIALLLGSASVSAGFRMRIFVYATCPCVMRPFFFVKWHFYALRAPRSS